MVHEQATNALQVFWEIEPLGLGDRLHCAMLLHQLQTCLGAYPLDSRVEVSTYHNAQVYQLLMRYPVFR